MGPTLSRKRERGKIHRAVLKAPFPFMGSSREADRRGTRAKRGRVRAAAVATYSHSKALPMTPKQLRFVAEYARCRDKVEAARASLPPVIGVSGALPRVSKTLHP